MMIEKEEPEFIGYTRIVKRRPLKDGRTIVKLANERPNGEVEPNSELAMVIARAVRTEKVDRGFRVGRIVTRATAASIATDCRSARRRAAGKCSQSGSLRPRQLSADAFLSDNPALPQRPTCSY